MAIWGKAPMYLPPTELRTGSLTVGTTRIAGPDIPVAYPQQVCLTADSANTANIFIGDSTVTATTGAAIPPGCTVLLNIDNFSKIHFISTAADQKVLYIVESR